MFPSSSSDWGSRMGGLDIALAPLLPGWALLVLAVAAAIIGGLGIFRRGRGAWLRLLFSITMLALLANPALVREQREALNDLVMVMVDRSPSQGIEARQQQADNALNELQQKLEMLPDTEVRVVETSGQDAGGEGGTFLFSEVGRVLAEANREQVGAIFVISDGQVHDVPGESDSLGIDAPLHLLRTGRDNERDRRLTLLNIPSYALVGRPVEVTFRVDDLPEAQEGRARVRVLLDGQVIEESAVPVGQEHRVAFELERRGPAAIEVEVEAAPDELTLINNRAGAIINGVRDRLRVLLISGEPHVGERAWRDILKSDPSVDLVHFTILRPPEKQDGTPISELALIAFPTRELFELKLHEFDLVVFDRYIRRGILPTSYYENVVSYVEEGGALLEAAGPATATPLSIHRTPLRAILPGQPTGRVVEVGYKPQLTDVGRRHPVTSGLISVTSDQEEPAWGRWFRLIETETTEGDVVMSGAENLPLLVLSRVGEGRIAQINSDQIWLWSRGYEGGGPQAELLRRTAHWLMKEPDLEEEDLRAEIQDGELLVTRRSLAEAIDQVEVTLPDGGRQTLTLEEVEPGVSAGRMPLSQAGLYRVSDGERVALAPAGPANPKEYEDPRASTELFAPLLQETGGTHAAISGGMPDLRKVGERRDRHGSYWMGVVAHGAYNVTGVQRVTLLPGLIALLLVLGTLLLAWRREGR